MLFTYLSRYILLPVAWVCMLLLSALLLWNIWFYVELGANHPFIAEKQAELGGSTIWQTNLILHIIAATACVIASLSQFSGIVQRRLPRWHRLSGRVYVYCVLLVVVPTGLYMGLLAKGGVLGVTAFLFMGVFAFFSTLRGLQMAILRDIPSHRAWMLRSYSMLATALSFRVYHLLFHAMGMEPDQNYLLSLWISVLGNWMIAEVIIKPTRFAFWRKSDENTIYHQPVAA